MDKGKVQPQHRSDKTIPDWLHLLGAIAIVRTGQATDRERETAVARLIESAGLADTLDEAERAWLAAAADAEILHHERSAVMTLELDPSIADIHRRLCEEWQLEGQPPLGMNATLAEGTAVDVIIMPGHITVRVGVQPAARSPRVPVVPEMPDVLGELRQRIANRARAERLSERREPRRNLPLREDLAMLAAAERDGWRDRHQYRRALVAAQRRDRQLYIAARQYLRDHPGTALTEAYSAIAERFDVSLQRVKSARSRVARAAE